MKEHAPPSIPVRHLEFHQMGVEKVRVVRVLRIWRDTKENSEKLIMSLFAFRHAPVHGLSCCLAKRVRRTPFYAIEKALLTLAVAV